MNRISTRVPDEQIEDVDALVEAGEFPTRSEAVHAAIRGLVDDSGAPQRERAASQARADGGQVWQDYNGGDRR